MLAACIFVAFRTLGTGTVPPPSKYERILQNVGEMLRQGHYSPKEINDDFSRKIFAKYFADIDPDKNIFLQEDLQALKKYETRLDDEIKGAPVEFFLEVGKIFRKRTEEASAIYKGILAKPFDFTADESLVSDSKKIGFPKNDAERRERIRKKLKYLALERYVEAQDSRAKAKDSTAGKTDAQLEKESRDKVGRIMDRMFDRYKFKFSDDDRFNIYVNTIVQAMDPHTDFFPPVEKRYFDEQLSGKFSGIGASLQYDDGNIKIATLLTGSPAMKSKQLEVGDVITRVAQGKEAPVELTGFVVEDAVKLIRGKTGTEVTLTVKKKDATTETVTLVREVIETDDTYARSAVIENGTSRIGYISLPEFYADFEDPNGRRCAADVAREVAKLKAAKVDGIVIDLRNNGGGSLYDVVQMAGLFIEDGPIVQVKDREGRPMVMRDKDNSVLYDGPLAVMVNEFSASASEIFAAAIQDYGRGVIIGSTTYGKGTVQRSFGLDPENFQSSNSELGSLKMTLQKFYRVNGGSTQLKGVTPDIAIPDQYEYLHYRERDNEDALPWDEISKAAYKTWNGNYDLQTIKNLSNNRVSGNPIFQQIRKNTDWLAKQSEREYPLNIEKYRKDQKEIKAVVQQVDSLMKTNKDLAIQYLKEDAARFEQDAAKKERYNQWLKDRSRDIYIDQAVKVLADVKNQQNLAKTPGKEAKPVKTF
ncbi:MAG: carboxyl-terminal protease [Flaviaesturariibacter sp.]|nr:carboxyl-terminal protease [Flaviaesturariibacter sp.]